MRGRLSTELHLELSSILKEEYFVFRLGCGVIQLSLIDPLAQRISTLGESYMATLHSHGCRKELVLTLLP